MSGGLSPAFLKRSSRYVATNIPWYMGTPRQTPFTLAASAAELSAGPCFFSSSATTSETSTSWGS